MTQPNKGVSKVANEMKTPVDEDPQSKSSKQLCALDNAFVRSHEIGTQEACCLLIRQQLICSTRTVVFINTNLPEKRNYLLKPMSQIEAMSDEGTDISLRNQQIRYTYRPEALKDVCLADFMSQYRMCYTKKWNKPDDRNPLVCGDSYSDGDNTESDRVVRLTDSSTVSKIQIRGTFV